MKEFSRVQTHVLAFAKRLANTQDQRAASGRGRTKRAPDGLPPHPVGTSSRQNRPLYHAGRG